MPIYPNKRKVMAGRFGFDTEKIQEGIDSGKVDTIAGITTAVGAGVSNIGKKDLGYGASHKGVGANTYGTGLQMAGTFGAAGAKIGGPMGLAIGAGVGMTAGMVSGFVNGKKDKAEAESLFKTNMSGALNKQAKESRANYGSLGSYKSRSYSNGGSIADGKAVIMGGKLHKDGGNPIVNAEDGQKIAETEREELLLTSEQTDLVDEYVLKFENEKSNTILEQLGRKFQNILLHETIDNSGIYGV
jgi:hypothetical protein